MISLAPCAGTRDSIVQDLGRVLSNHYDYPDSPHTVTSYCRVADGTWIGWTTSVPGESFYIPGTTTAQRMGIKASWPSQIASTNVVGVGYFPDDETAPIVYELGIDPIWQWDGVGFYGSRDVCSIHPFIGDIYSDDSKCILAGWGMGLIDVQVRTDGTNVWVIALAREDVKYTNLYNSPLEIDACRHAHPTLEGYWAGGHSNPFIHDTDSGSRFWLYQAGQFGGNMPFGPYDDPGENRSLRWQPARVTVWAGDIGGFTRLDTIEAQFGNHRSSGLCSGIEAAASPAEPGVLHLLWSEGGDFGPKTTTPFYGERINYSRWDFTSKTLDTDLYFSYTPGAGLDASDPPVFTAEMVLRNDHGAPIAVVWPPDTAGISRVASGAAEFWDLSTGTAQVLQTADLALAPTAAEGNNGGFLDSVFTQSTSSSFTGSVVTNLRRSQYASSLYTDPTLGNTDVYLLCVGYGQGVQRSGCKAFLRVPCDGSATFDYMDGTRLSTYSIIPGSQFVTPFNTSYFGADFVSDPRNVWMPTHIIEGGGILHLTRICERLWELLPAFPDNGIPGSGYEIGDWGAQAEVQPPTLLTDDDGDWIAGGGNGPILTTQTSSPTNIAAIRAKICRCCIRCVPLNLHIWQRF